MDESQITKTNRRTDEMDKGPRLMEKDTEKDSGKDVEKERSRTSESKDEGSIGFFNSKFWKKKREVHTPEESDTTDTGHGQGQHGKGKGKTGPIIINTETLTQEGIQEILSKVRPRTDSVGDHPESARTSRASSIHAPGSMTSVSATSTGQKRKRATAHEEVQVISDDESEEERTKSPEQKKKKNADKNRNGNGQNDEVNVEGKKREKYIKNSQIALLKKIKGQTDILSEVAMELQDKKSTEGRNLDKVVRDVNLMIEVLMNKIAETGREVVRSLDSSRSENIEMRKELRKEIEKRTGLETELSHMLNRHGRIVEELRNDTSGDSRMIREIMERDEIMKKNLEGLGIPQAMSSPKDKDHGNEETEILGKIEEIIDQKLDKRLGYIEKLLNERLMGGEKEKVHRTSNKTVAETQVGAINNPGNAGRTTGEQPWSVVVGRRAAKTNKRVSGTPTTKVVEGGSKNVIRVKQTNARAQASAINKIRTSKTTAIVLKDSKGKVEETMRDIREKIDIKKYEFTGIKTKKSQAGHLVLELEGDPTGQKTEQLRDAIHKVTEGKEDLRVYVPERNTEILIKNFDLTLGEQDIKTLLAEKCETEKNNIIIGKINVYKNGTRTIWAKCPTKVVGKLLEKEGARQMMGWATVDVEVLKARPTQCYKCWGFGHIAPNCKSDVDHSGKCFKCGREGHSPEICISPPGCLLCREAKEKSDHRMGSKLCNALRQHLQKTRGVAERTEGGAEPEKTEKMQYTAEKEKEGNTRNKADNKDDTHWQEVNSNLDKVMGEKDGSGPPGKMDVEVTEGEN